MQNRIYFFANIGDWNKQPYGGGEVGNRRTIKLLQDLGYDVHLIEKYKRVENHSVINLIVLLTKMIINICEYFFILLFGRRKHSVVHIAGFYGTMVYFESILVGISKMLGYYTIYEMRGGGAEQYYQDGTVLYRHFFNFLIKNPNVIFSQGLENKDIINSITPKKHTFYYPNFVTSDFLPTEYPQKEFQNINILYFGRISKTKNIDIVIDCINVLNKKNININLSIVGDCPDEDYGMYIKRKIDEYNLVDIISIHKACNHEKLKEYLIDKHFYIFPTTEPHEGHSNALTEAMAWGVIPVATSQGFNRSIIGNNSLIVKDLKAEQFASIIEDILSHDKLQEYSKAAYTRIKDNYTDILVKKNLEKEYMYIFDTIR